MDVMGELLGGLWQLVGQDMKLWGLPIIYYFVGVAAIGMIIAFIKGKK